MRTLVLVGSVLLCVPSFARNHSRPAQKVAVSATVAAVDDEPFHEVAKNAVGLDTGQRQEVQIAAPSVKAVAESGTLEERGPATGEPSARAREDEQPMSGVKIEELAARQMRRYQRAIDGCIATVQHKAPATSGSLDLVISVVDHKVAAVEVADDSVKSAQLSSCLTKLARSWSFSLPNAQFSKSVTLSPQASR